MSKKSDAYYFDTFTTCAKFGLEAAKLMDETLRNFDPSRLKDVTEAMHKIEHEADDTQHEMINRLAKEFVTPLEREDIIELAHRLDDVVDNIEDVLMRTYYDDIQDIREDILSVTELLIENCEEMVKLVEEMRNFRKTNNSLNHIMNINRIEGEADVLYIKNMRNLHVNETDVLKVIAWRDLYKAVEFCHDDCEKVASTVQTIILKNS